MRAQAILLSPEQFLLGAVYFTLKAYYWIIWCILNQITQPILWNLNKCMLLLL